MLGIIIVCCLISGAFSQGFKEESCLNVTSKVVDLDRIYGEWYEYKHSSNVKSGGDRCFKGFWGKEQPQDKAEIISTNNVQRLGLTSTMVTSYNFRNGLMKFTHYVPLLGKITLESSVLEVDYQNYVVMLGCREREGPAMFWVYTRQPEPPCDFDIEGKIRYAFEKNGFQMPDMVKSDNNCFETAY